MTTKFSRRALLAGIASTAAVSAKGAAVSLSAFPMRYPFRLSVINDEISQDFGHACEIAAKEFGLSWIELRGMWNKNLLNLDENEVKEARKILERYKLRVTDIASPLFKVDWPGAPPSRFAPQRDQFNADFTFNQQDLVLERSLQLARAFNTDRIRCFDFWRLDDPSQYRAAIDAKLRTAAEKAGKHNIILVLENEMSCNTGTGSELARTLGAIDSPFLMGNWDPGNAATLDEVPYPNGYEKLPQQRIGHVHCKDARKKPNAAGYEWAPMGAGMIDWLGQFRALKRDGYHYAVSLETHWRGAGTPEESTRQSMAGMKRLLQQAVAA
jgi:L-ribulose-5-phosphate 3-epimerase